MVDEQLDSIATFHEAEINPERTWRIDGGKPEPFIRGAVPWKPRQLLTPAFQLNAAVYAFRPDRLPADSPSILFGDMGAEIVPADSVIDIDTLKDFALRQCLTPILKPHRQLSDLLSLKGSTALVVGGAGLLGGEISHAFAELGAELFIASRDVEKCRTFIDGLERRYPGAKAHALGGRHHRCGIDQAAACRRVGAKTGGGLDILVNSGWSGRKNTFESISDADWDLDIEVCLNGVFRTVKAAVPLLKQKRGNILTIASMYGHVAPDYRLYDGDKFVNPPSYGAAKAGVHAVHALPRQFPVAAWDPRQLHQPRSVPVREHAAGRVRISSPGCRPRIR